MIKISIILLIIPLLYLAYAIDLVNTNAHTTEDFNTSVAPGTGWQNVPGNALYNTEEFSVMQYEAKYDCTGDGIGDTAEACSAVANSGFGLDYRDIISFDSDKVVSTAEGAPIVHISHNQAENASPAGRY